MLSKNKTKAKMYCMSPNVFSSGKCKFVSGDRKISGCVCEEADKRREGI